QWIRYKTEGIAPAPRFAAAVAYDRNGNKLILFGGANADLSGPYRNDAWVLSNANGLGGTPRWMQLQPSNTPPTGRRYLSGAYVPATNRFIIFGGLVGSNQDLRINETWVLTDANGTGGTPQWIQLAPSGPIPLGRASYGMEYDESSDRL